MDESIYEICKQLVSREVQVNVSDMVTLSYGEKPEDQYGIPDDKVENLYAYPEYYGKYAKFEGGSEEQRDAEVERLNELKDHRVDVVTAEVGEPDEEEIDLLIDEIKNEIYDLEHLETEPQEIFEWWIVSGFLAEKLKSQGEPVYEGATKPIWGRTTTGQAIALDGVIQRIAEEMEILPGQKYSWADNK